MIGPARRLAELAAGPLPKITTKPQIIHASSGSSKSLFNGTWSRIIKSDLNELTYLETLHNSVLGLLKFNLISTQKCLMAHSFVIAA
jgi:hypothetical protein